MKFTGRIKRFIAILLVMVMTVGNIYPQSVYADSKENSSKKSKAVLTDLEADYALEWVKCTSF